MKTFFKIILLLTIISFYQCNQPKKENENSVKIKKKKTKKKVVLEKEIIKPWDSLNSQNTAVFLTEYGKQNPENKMS